MKGLIKGSIKYISQIFVHKDHEMQIGYPTDVKHVSHIGSDSPFGSAPSWMNEFTAPSSDISSGSPSNFNSRTTSWASLDFDRQVKDQQSPPQTEQPCPDIPKAPKKMRKKKDRSAGRLSSARSSSVSRSSYTTAVQDTRN